MTDRDYRDTVFLPTTSFPMRGDLPKREPAMLQRWEDTGLFAQLRAQGAQRAEKFILHDGPPYANGNIHIGHALNKILKDVINRARQMAGYDAYYIPGWDCHGLPIEWQIEEKYRKEGRDKDSVPILQFRAECRAHAQKWLDVQAEEFKRLGIFGDWANRYATMDFGSEATIATEIHRFAQNGALYRGLRPVLWSVVEKTALAEAEVEYADHTSTTIWVRFPVTTPGDLQNASIVIWTTTPWTIPGNRAIAYGPEIDYARIHVDAVSESSLCRPGESLLVALPLLPQFLTDAGITLHHVLHVHRGTDLAGLVCAHPLRGHDYDFDVPLLPGDFVTTDQGTGFVHMAPAHGEDDFALCKAHGIDVPETVADDGTYFPWVPLFPGVHVFKAAKPVCDALIAAGALVKQGTVTHSYPHSWRSKAPLIFRATPQWFIRMDGPEHIRDQALTAIANTAFVPEAGRTRLSSMVANRPDWCISRQRAWGVPIAIFTNKRTGEILRDPDVFARTIEAFRTEGADAWYASPPARFLGNTYDANDYEQVHDIVDVWFESGCTNVFTLLNRNLPWPADLYLEGSDQHRGWFQSSLLEGIGARGQAPFKAILTHGFTLDEQGRKMSKSIGNTMAPQKITDEYGADILRLWVMNTDITEDQRIGKEILKQQAELYRRLRNTLRWLLGSLEGFTESERLDYADMPELERYILHQLATLDGRIRRAIDTHDWTGVYPFIHSFCSLELSAFYFDIRKDALYCDRADSLRRRAARTVLDALHRCLTIWLAPVLCFTSEEAWTVRFGNAQSVHLQTFPSIPNQWWDVKLAERWALIRDARRDLTGGIELLRGAGEIGSSLQASVDLGLPPLYRDLLDASSWQDLAIVSELTLSETDPAIQVRVVPAPGTKCARCWRVLPEVGTVHAHPTLCLRCTDAVDHLDAQKAAA
jgi:isoleucyl-tRNA synthetase